MIFTEDQIAEYSSVISLLTDEETLEAFQEQQSNSYIVEIMHFNAISLVLEAAEKLEYSGKDITYYNLLQTFGKDYSQSGHMLDMLEQSLEDLIPNAVKEGYLEEIENQVYALSDQAKNFLNLRKKVVAQAGIALENPYLQ